MHPILCVYVHTKFLGSTASPSMYLFVHYLCIPECILIQTNTHTHPIHLSVHQFAWHRARAALHCHLVFITGVFYDHLKHIVGQAPRLYNLPSKVYDSHLECVFGCIVAVVSKRWFCTIFACLFQHKYTCNGIGCQTEYVWSKCVTQNISAQVSV